MPETMTLAGTRPAKLFAANAGAVELVGRSNAITRVQELLRRAAAADSGTLITGEAGSAVESVARELHGRSRQSAAAFVIVECGAVDAAGVDRLLFGAPPDAAPADLESVTRDSSVTAAIGGGPGLSHVHRRSAGAQWRP